MVKEYRALKSPEILRLVSKKTPSNPATLAPRLIVLLTA